MTSHSLANVLGWIVLVVVLGASVFYGPLGQFGKPKPAVVQPAQPRARRRRPSGARDQGSPELVTANPCGTSRAFLCELQAATLMPSSKAPSLETTTQ